MTKHPNFFMVGVVKGGTTSLHYYLGQHPQIYMSPVKETNFFSRSDIDPSAFSMAYTHAVDIDLKRYLASGMKEMIHIAHVTDEADYLGLFANVTQETAIGEASNSYILYDSAPRMIHQSYPDAKIIIMLRNPVKRAFSHYLMNLRLGKTLQNDFISELQSDEASEKKGWGANHQYLPIGLYYEQISRIYEIFPMEQVLLCWFEDYQQDGAALVRSIYRFLGVKDDFETDTSEQFNIAGVARFKKLNYLINQIGLLSWAKRRLPGSWREPFKRFFYATDKQAIPAMTVMEKRFLTNYYREDIVNLGKLLNKDLSHWLN